ncbi:hypothetical protein PP655_gp032 [Bacillus phage PBC4]|uniref:Uncharacterized protein n=1 Tax=Bacillus phage PBC4 TaxID=1675028 RepID=A0A1D6X876_9CAUD|nr:hypothetical protein PP655_gp032 [Bacillus phage PBC4]AKQ08224.1 hypothetical protein PBC4_032 [Bacillus phage PBC4]
MKTKENYLLLGVMNDGTVKTSKVIKTEEPEATDFNVIKGQMSNLLGSGRRKDWYFRTHLIEIQGE